MKKRVIISLFISIFFLYLVLKNVDFVQTFTILSKIKLIYVFIMLFLTIIIIILRSLRWKAMFSENVSFSLINFFESIALALMANNLLPFRSGDIIQVFFLNYKTGISKSTILSTVMMERLSDFITMCLILITGSFFVFLPYQFHVTWIMVVLFFILFLIFIFLKMKILSFKILEKVIPPCKLRDKVSNVIKNFHTGLEFISRYDILARIIIYTLFIWMVSGLIFYSGLLSVGIELNLFSAIFLLSMTGLAVMIPSSPGYIGPLDFILITGLGIFGIEKDHTLSFIIIYRVMSYFPNIIIGLIVLLRNNLNFNFISKKLEI